MTNDGLNSALTAVKIKQQAKPLVAHPLLLLGSYLHDAELSFHGVNGIAPLFSQVLLVLTADVVEDLCRRPEQWRHVDDFIRLYDSYQSDEVRDCMRLLREVVSAVGTRV